MLLTPSQLRQGQNPWWKVVFYICLSFVWCGAEAVLNGCCVSDLRVKQLACLTLCLSHLPFIYMLTLHPQLNPPHLNLQHHSLIFFHLHNLFHIPLWHNSPSVLLGVMQGCDTETTHIPFQWSHESTRANTVSSAAAVTQRDRRVLPGLSLSQKPVSWQLTSWAGSQDSLSWHLMLGPQQPAHGATHLCLVLTQAHTPGPEPPCCVRATWTWAQSWGASKSPTGMTTAAWLTQAHTLSHQNQIEKEKHTSACRSAQHTPHVASVQHDTWVGYVLLSASVWALFFVLWWPQCDLSRCE